MATNADSARKKVAVLMGGVSAERAVSLVSGRDCAAALREGGFEVVEIDAGPDLPARLIEAAPDVAFNALHGRFGEDGCVQGMLEWLRIPYTHSGVAASALAMDKARSKALFETVGLPVAPYVLARPEEIAADHVLDGGYVVKPVDEGSSVGVVIVPAGANRPPAFESLAPPNRNGVLMAEAYAPGRELTVTVMDDRPLVVTEIISDGWYDYDAKYRPGGSRHALPADVPDEVTKAALEIALRAHQALGCRGASRSDFRYEAQDPIKTTRGVQSPLILLETNTQPGMTPTSLTPEQAAYVGVDFVALTRWMVADASTDR